ncbi:MAG TPA: SRPBCC family protein [Polyangiaceae bacterium]|nr:SRPBCC family protein [Polyangiaceae bacterium]
MDATEDETKSPRNRATVERKSDREIVVTRTVNGPARLVFEAFTKAELFKRWWVPKSLGLTLLSCEVDARVGGKYRLVFEMKGSPPMAFFGTYREVVPGSRLVWTNEESGESGSVTTATFEERGEKTLLTIHELYPTKEACDADAGSKDGIGETFEQLDELLGTLGASAA